MPLNAPPAVPVALAVMPVKPDPLPTKNEAYTPDDTRMPDDVVKLNPDVLLNACAPLHVIPALCEVAKVGLG